MNARSPTEALSKRPPSAVDEDVASGWGWCAVGGSIPIWPDEALPRLFEPVEGPAVAQEPGAPSSPRKKRLDGWVLGVPPVGGGALQDVQVVLHLRRVWMRGGTNVCVLQRAGLGWAAAGRACCWGAHLKGELGKADVDGLRAQTLRKGRHHVASAVPREGLQTEGRHPLRPLEGTPAGAARWRRPRRRRRRPRRRPRRPRRRPRHHLSGGEEREERERERERKGCGKGGFSPWRRVHRHVRVRGCGCTRRRRSPQRLHGLRR